MLPRRSLKRCVLSLDMVALNGWHTQVSNADIQKLLSMADMWRLRDKPTPPDFDAIMEGSFVVKEPPDTQAASSSNTKGQVNGHANGAFSSNGNGGLRAQPALILQDNIAFFVSRYSLV